MTEPLKVDGEKLYAKLAWRIIPFMFILYIAAFLNRANIAYAKLTFTVDLNISEVAYGIGYGVFFIGRVALEQTWQTEPIAVRDAAHRMLTGETAATPRCAGRPDRRACPR